MPKLETDGSVLRPFVHDPRADVISSLLALSNQSAGFILEIIIDGKIIIKTVTTKVPTFKIKTCKRSKFIGTTET